jgi:hypothetical protein
MFNLTWTAIAQGNMQITNRMLLRNPLLKVNSTWMYISLDIANIKTLINRSLYRQVVER